VVCATNKNLEQMVADGSFREDLYYRISELTIDIPPLRDRESDKILLARHFLQQMAEEQHRSITGFTPEAAEAIENHTWPGNVREMENKIKRALIMCESKLISVDDLGLNDCSEGREPALNLRHVRQEAEKSAIINALTMADNNISSAAKLLGVTRPTLYDLIKKYDIQMP
jgi:two-component system NtrC family response regulator